MQHVKGVGYGEELRYVAGDVLGILRNLAQEDVQSRRRVFGLFGIVEESPVGHGDSRNLAASFRVVGTL